VVLATVGRPELLPRVVEAVLGDPATLELLVVVDGPDAASTTVLEALAVSHARLRHIVVPHQGQLGALDEGVRRAVGDVLVLLDDDVLPGPATITGHVAHHRTARRLVVTGPMPVVVRGTTPPDVGTRLYEAEYRAHIAAIERGELGVLDALWTGNLSMRRVDCLSVGLRSPTFSAHYHADQDLGFRLQAAGMVGTFDPALEAEHLHSRDDDDFLRDARRQGAGRAVLHRAHPDRLGPFSPAMLVADLPAPLRAAVRLAGATRLAGPLTKALMGAGHRCASVGRPEAQLVAAKLARRIMQWHGAVAGDTACGTLISPTRRTGRAPRRG
jgi:GT2 family glycosyltransferase